jgi:prepilin-type N-terminal cleavage/methylation domain-containing protein
MTGTKKGFSLVEMLLAGALFTVFASGVVEVLLTSLSLNRLGAETTIAKEYAAAGIEAVYSMKAADFTALTNTEATGIERQDGDWVFSGNENTFDKYTRSISISEVSRDDDGAIVESGGDTDEETKKVTATVTWDFNNSRSNTVTLETYLTAWQE